MRRLNSIRTSNRSVIDTLSDILKRGYEAGLFVRRVDPVDLHLMISAYCFFRVSNRHTFGSLFGVDLSKAVTRAGHKSLLRELILSFLQSRETRLSAVLTTVPLE
jgi:hypothetical protein